MTKQPICYLLYVLLLFTGMACNPDTSCYYLDAVNGNDNNNGHSEQQAWQSLAKLQSVKLQPGDRVLLKRGTTYTGQLEITGQGTPINRIYIESYGEGGGGSGILIVNGGKDVVSVFDSLTIQNCRILRCSRNAMIWASAYSSRENWQPSKHTIIRNNLIEEVPGDGIVPIGCDSTLIERNVMRNCPAILPDTEAAAGIWPWSCDNTLIRFNEVSDHKAPWDAQGFDSDWNCTNTIIEYNYSHDNEGGMVLICNSGEASESFNIGNRGTIVRYNISINDGIRTRPTRVGTFSPNIHLAGPVKHTTISNNILHVNKKPEGKVDRSMITFDSWGGYSDSTLVKDNIFYTPETTTFNFTESTHNTFDGNYYLGNFKVKPQDANARYLSEAYQKILDADAEGFGGLSCLMDTVSVAGSEGVFVNKEAIQRLFESMR